MLDYGFYNMDCMDGMKQFPDKYFDLAIVDPPYGDGGGQWKRQDKSRFGGVFDRYRPSALKSAQERERERGSHEQAEHGRASSAKKSFRGMWLRLKSILTNSSASHGIKLYGAEIILNFHRQDAFSCGKSTFQKISQWLCVSMRGLHSMRMQKCLNIHQ